VSIIGIAAEPAVINCSEGAGLVFYNMTSLTIEHVIIQHCGSVVNDDHPLESVIPNTDYHFYNVTIGVLIALSCDVTVHMVTITETFGIGLVCINAVGHVTLNSMTFSNNRPSSIEECNMCLFLYKSNVNCIYDPNSISGALLLLYIDSSNNSANVYVTGTTFIDNFSCSLAALSYAHPNYQVGDGILSVTGGMEIMMTQSNFSVNVEITSSTFINNTGIVGSGLSIEIFESAQGCRITVENCTFVHNGHLNWTTGITSYGGALSVIPYLTSATHAVNANHSLVISNSVFENNSAIIGGAIYIPNTHARFSELTNLLTTINHSNFSDNHGVLGHVLYTNGMDFTFNLYSVIIEHSIFCNNVVDDLYDSIFSPQSFGVIYFSQISAVVSNSVFVNNIGSAINLVYSTLSLKENITFQDNRAISGGGIYLQYYSDLVFLNNSRVTFINNSASLLGGAIYYEYKFNPAGNIFSNCFIYFNSLDPYCVLKGTCYSTEMNITVSFIDNNAGYGSAIFGSGLYCPWLLQHTRQNYSTIDVPEVLSQNFSEVLQFSPSVTHNYVIATTSKTIQSNVSEVNIMPGQITTVYLNATDHYGRPAVDSVAADLFSRQFKVIRNFSSIVLPSGYQLIQGVSLTATDIQINGTENRSTTLVIYSLNSAAQTRIPAYVSSCAFGFTYNLTQHACLCDSYLKDNGVMCDYHTGNLIKPKHKWIGVLDDKIVILPCIYDYCSSDRSVNTQDFDEQCKDNRGGILCGGCKSGYGAKTGYTGCEKCDGIEHVLIFILSLLLTGIWIFFVTSFLRIYVSDGHSYPIYFYVNILFLFRNAVFSTFHKHLRPKEYFYAILNVRGVYNFCIHNNIGPLALAGLDFTFPLYLLLIVIAITLYSRLRGPYNERFGHSTTKVFATVLYICYSLLMDYSFSILNFVTISTPSGKQVRWKVNPDVHYFKGWHGVLGGVSIFILLILNTVAIVLLFPRQAYRFKKVQRLKPLIDAFQAPFKLRYSFWIGLQFVLRVCLHIIAFTVPIEYQLYVAGSILCTLLYVQTLCSPYKDDKINALDNLFLVMLIVQFIESLATTKIPVLVTTCEIVFGIFYVLFVAIHIARRFPIIKRHALLVWIKLRSFFSYKSIRDQYTEINSFAEDKSDLSTPNEPFITSIRTDYASVPSTTIPDIPPEAVNYSELREPILELDDGN